MRMVVGGDAGMRLVDNDELGASPDEFVTPDVGLDVVETDDGERMGAEDAVRLEQRPFEAPRRRGRHGDRRNLEF